ncbi:glucuronate isomerase [Monaibacterium marinum]|uniref:Uronate isomerase n=1 Tax=Pontivivens marinum TaxID=1690039 RepID=A0A2C9CVZ5_9RHOB|nr:glucuronate isomerase [Monaibacterium marinum]SOH95536.1 glucuronate isomerase [Monaibacterium marinum]
MNKAPTSELPPVAMSLYEGIRDLPIVSPHGHCDPVWWAKDARFSDPAALLIQPDHYVFRMLYSQGVPLGDLGIGPEGRDRDPRAVFRLFARHWDLFLGTPSRQWLEHTLYHTLGVEAPLAPETADAVYDQIEAKLASPVFRPRALFDRFGISLLATTDPATSPLSDHTKIAASGLSGRVVPTFRPDDLLNPQKAGHRAALSSLATMTDRDTDNYDEFIAALRDRRAAFRSAGATATDHDVPDLQTCWLDRDQITALHARAVAGTLNHVEARAYYGHMLVEMAQMSAEDGLVMQIHAGSRRNTNKALSDAVGPDMGADIPGALDWVGGLGALLNRVGNDPRLRVLVFTLDESTYARELAPMAGHWPCLRIGPPWWFHDSLNGIRRYFDNVVETAGYYNLAGFNDDTRAFLSIPARHNMWRRGVALHLADQIARGVLNKSEAARLGDWLAHDAAIDAYRIEGA